MSPASKSKSTSPRKNHQWRLCPAGQHWVRTHDLQIPVSKKNPDGVTIRHGHCANNPSHKDEFYPDEMEEIAKIHFANLGNEVGKLDPKKWDKRNPNLYDDLIAGWTKYWNEVLEPKVPLDPNIIKALIASESSFNPKPKDGRAGKDNMARGLLQVTDDTRKILEDEHGELKDHLINVTKDEIYDPNLNICSGIRWLFQMQKLAYGQLKRQATWEEAVANYKSVLGKTDKRSAELMNRFKEYYRALRLN